MMASPVYLRDSALSISSDSFVEQSGNFKVLFRPPRLSRVRTALAGPSPLPRARPYPQPLRRKTGTARLGPRGRGPQRVLSPAPRLPIGSASYLLAPEIRKRSPPVPLKDGETGSGPAGHGGQDSPHSWTPPARAQLPTPRPRPAPETSQKKAPKAWRAGLGPRSPTLPTSPRTGVGVLVGAGAAAAP